MCVEKRYFLIFSLSIFSFVCFSNEGSLKAGHVSQPTSEIPNSGEDLEKPTKEFVSSFSSNKSPEQKAKDISEMPNEELKLIASEVCGDPDFFLQKIGNEMIEKTNLDKNPILLNNYAASYFGGVPYYVTSKEEKKNCEFENSLKRKETNPSAFANGVHDVHFQEKVKFKESSKYGPNGSVSIFPIYTSKLDAKWNKECVSMFEVELNKSGNLVAHIKDAQGIKATVLCAEGVKLEHFPKKTPPIRASYIRPIKMDNPFTKNEPKPGLPF